MFALRLPHITQLEDILSVLLPLGWTETACDVFRLLYILRNSGGKEQYRCMCLGFWSKKFIYIVLKSAIPTSHKPQHIYDKKEKWIKYFFKYFMTMQWCFAMRVRPTSAYENMWIYYITIFVNLLHVSVTFCGHLQGVFFSKHILQRQPRRSTNIKYCDFTAFCDCSWRH